MTSTTQKTIILKRYGQYPDFASLTLANITLVFAVIYGLGVEFTEFGFCSPLSDM